MKMPFGVFQYSIQNAANDSVDVFIEGDIVDAATQSFYKEWYGDDTSVSFKSFRQQLQASDAKTYNVYINSYGGLVTDAMAMHDLLQDMRRNGKVVNTIGRGIIASAATYVLMAGSSTMTKNSWFMIHNVSGGVWGDVNLVESYAKTLRKFNDASRDFYASATGKRKEDITKMMDAETWMTAQEAKDHGFIQMVSGEAQFTNTISNEKWLFSNTAVLNAYNAAVKPENLSHQNQIEEMKKFFQDLGTQILNAIKGVKAPENNDHSTLMQSIGEAVGNQFNSAADQIDNAVTEVVNKAVADAVKNAVDSAVAEAVKPLNDKISTLETQKGELEKDITQLKGNKTTQETPEGPKIIGGFVKK